MPGRNIQSTLMVQSPGTNTHSNTSLPACNPTPANSDYFLCSLIYTTPPLKERKWQKEKNIYNTVVSRPETRKKPFLWFAEHIRETVWLDGRESRWAHPGILQTDFIHTNTKKWPGCLYTRSRRSIFERVYHLPADMKQEQLVIITVIRLIGQQINWTQRLKTKKKKIISLFTPC